MNNSKDSLITAASFSPYSLQFPDAWIGHLPFASWLIRSFEPQIFVELGTHSGNSYFSFCQATMEGNIETKCYAVDTWQGDEHAGNYSDEIFQQVNAYNQEHYASFSRLLRMTFDEALSYFSDGSIALLHIDGLHTYEAVKHDFESWLPKLASGAVVLFHDTNVRERGFGVWKVWEELQATYPNNLEFLHSHGLGVLQLDGATADKKLIWLEQDASDRQQLKDYFAALGTRQLERFELSQTKILFNQLLAERDEHIAELNQSLAERDEHIAELNQSLAERDEHIAELNQSLAERGTIIQKYVSSTSWRITAPLRFFASMFK
jgi:O-antigen biosynthesis protein